MNFHSFHNALTLLATPSFGCVEGDAVSEIKYPIIIGNEYADSFSTSFYAIAGTNINCSISFRVSVFCRGSETFHAVYFAAQHADQSFFSTVLLFVDYGPEMELIGQINFQGVPGNQLIWENMQIKMSQIDMAYPPLVLWDFENDLQRRYYESF